LRIVTAIKCKEKPILHKEIDAGFGLRSCLCRRLVVSLLEVVWKDGMGKSGAVSECRHNVLLNADMLAEIYRATVMSVSFILIANQEFLYFSTNAEYSRSSASLSLSVANSSALSNSKCH